MLAHDPTATFYEDEVRCPVQVGDLADALVELAGGDLTGVLHVAGPEAVSRHQFAELITGRPVRHAPAPAGRPLDCRLDTSHAAATLATVLRGVSEVYAALTSSGPTPAGTHEHRPVHAGPGHRPAHGVVGVEQVGRPRQPRRELEPVTSAAGGHGGGEQLVAPRVRPSRCSRRRRAGRRTPPAPGRWRR